MRTAMPGGKPVKVIGEPAVAGLGKTVRTEETEVAVMDGVAVNVADGVGRKSELVVMVAVRV